MFKEGDVVQYGPDFRNEGWRGFTCRIERVVQRGDVHLDAEVFVINPADTGVVKGAQVGTWNFYSHFYAEMKKIGEGDVYVGQRVVIAKNSIFHGGITAANPKCGGVVQLIERKRPLNIKVLWDNGCANYYRYEDLVCEGALKDSPKPKKREHGLLGQINESVKLLNDLGGRPTAAYMGLYKHEKPEVNSTNACHAGLNRGIVGCRMVVSCIKQGVESHPWFYKWLIDESPWSSAFYRRYAWSRKNKVVVVRTDVGSAFMLGALFATRIWEGHVGIKLVKELKKHLPIEFLYPICCQLKCTDGGYGVEVSRGGHFPFNHMPSGETVSNFVMGRPVAVGLPYSETGSRGDGDAVSSVFGPAGADVWLVDSWKRFDGVKKKASPFGMTHYYTKDKKVLIEFLKQQLEKILK